LGGLARCGQEEHTRLAAEPLCSVGVTSALVGTSRHQALADLSLYDLIDFRCAQDAPPGLPAAKAGNGARRSIG
jgi:hypothetical protein